MFYLTLPSVANINLYSRCGQVDDLYEQHFKRQLRQKTCITKKLFPPCVVSGFRHEVDEKCALLECYAASSGNSLPTFRYNLSHLQGLRIFLDSLDNWPLKMGPTGCPETSSRNYHYSLHCSPEERTCHPFSSLFYGSLFLFIRPQ
jgi:hypothetical protein